MARKYCLILCLLVNAVQIYGYGPPSLNKASDSYTLAFGEEPPSTHSQGYVELANNLLQEFKSGKVNVDALKKFNTGLEQYFLFKLYEKDANDFLTSLPKSSDISDPVALNDYSDENISFTDVKVYGYPAFKNNNPEFTYDTFESATEYKIKIGRKSDVIIFTGTFTVSNSSYFFVYNLKKNNYSTHVYSVRGLGQPSGVKFSLQFANEEFLHTYDSTYENYVQVNEAVAKNFTDLFLKVYFYDLSLKVRHRNEALHAENNIKFISEYRKNILSLLVDSAIQYVTAKGLNSFEVKPLNFTSDAGFRVFVRLYKNIKLDGLLNFVKYELINSTLELSGENYTQAKLSEAIKLTYPDEGEKQTFISFVIANERSESAKKFRVKSITIIAVYDSLLTERPFKVSRNKEVFFNGKGFLIKFELDDFDPTLGFLVGHVGNDISRAIEEVLLTETV